MDTEKPVAPYVHCIDHVGISTANFQATISFFNSLLGLEHRFADDFNFGCDPALLCVPGNNSGIALCPGTSRGLNYLAFRVSELGFQHTQYVFRGLTKLMLITAAFAL
jgi:catechol 2,3-dioxygenase-like lactoylglutathione lyase family enzyme